MISPDGMETPGAIEGIMGRLRLPFVWKQRLLFALLLLVTEPCAEEPVDSFSDDRSQEVNDVRRKCTDRFGFHDQPEFNLRSCAFCYKYLFPTGKPLAPHPPSMLQLRHVNTSLFVVPDPLDSRATDLVCSTLSADECRRWIDCCNAAVVCCTVQLEVPRLAGHGDHSHCGRVWDGYSCWEDTAAGTTAYMPCPFHLEHSVTTKSAAKSCNSNGTWLEKGGYQWTDYRPCIDKQVYLIGVYMSFGCNAVGVLLLIPAIVIFCMYRDLLKQHRIRIHINFFASLVLCNCVTITWYYLVHHDLLVNSINTETVLYRNPTWCRLLSFVKIYSTSATYFWMFNEGFYLHRLITHTFEPPKSLNGLYLFGWMIPAIAAIVYGIIRGTKDNVSCWAKSFGEFEWIIYVPNFLCMVLNFVFLCNILRILMFRLHSHPHEPSNFRRGVKAAFMLIPLFGIQLFLTIYRPPIGMQTEMIHECMFLFTTNSQGIFVSLIFCFFNKEVLSRLPFAWNRRRWCCCCCCGSGDGTSSPRSRGVSIQLTHFTMGDMRQSMSNVAFCPGGGSVSPQNGRLLLLGTAIGGGGGGGVRTTSPISGHSSLSPAIGGGGGGLKCVDRKRKLSSMSTATEVDHVEHRSPPDSPPPFTSQR